ncbi:MAG: 16S rRNA (uracil(1498)-N(3))-methyltransferase, partial [Actinomycetota bacterium]|nr:16S rRNA (uracil(1498)-N(3))-methyltransferase [Actinomycetota bacterium]
MTLALLLVDALPAVEAFTLDGPEGRHAATVRRSRVGEELLISDGAGTVAQCVVTAVAHDALEVRVNRRWTDPVPSPRVVVV